MACAFSLYIYNATEHHTDGKMTERLQGQKEQKVFTSKTFSSQARFSYLPMNSVAKSGNKNHKVSFTNQIKISFKTQIRFRNYVPLYEGAGGAVATFLILGVTVLSEAATITG